MIRDFSCKNAILRSRRFHFIMLSTIVFYLRIFLINKTDRSIVMYYSPTDKNEFELSNENLFLFLNKRCNMVCTVMMSGKYNQVSYNKTSYYELKPLT